MIIIIFMIGVLSIFLVIECCDHIIKGGKKCDKGATVITESGKKLCNLT